jgi:adenylosuccinate synthase
MPATIIVGLQWGDEGKGKIVDYLAPKYDLNVRYQGGNNAGHTVVVGDVTYKLHFIPSGAVRGKKVAIGNGCVVNPDALLQEIINLENLGIRNIDLTISDRAHVITQEHLDMDSGGGGHIGTTKRGIGPCYTAKVARKGIRMGEYAKTHPEIQKYVGDVSLLVNEMLDSGQNVLLEGAQGTMLDIDHGTYPFVTSSNTIAGGACTGVGISPKKIDRIIGVAKAYTTRVGEGPFPTELTGTPTGDYITERGKEIGTSTGRIRRPGWFDSVVGRRASRVNGIDEIAILKLDVLTGIGKYGKLKLCYSYDVDGKDTLELPESLDDCKPNYVELFGWNEDIRHATKIDNLPAEAKTYLEALYESLNHPNISMIGVGPERDQIIVS